jgi:nucleotide-binding universal stress UspA family protein
MANEPHTPLILAGWDGRDRTRDGLALAALFARLLGAGVEVVHVAPRAIDDLGLGPELEQAARRAVGRAPMELLDGLDPQTRVVPGSSPAEGLQRAAEESGADLVVLGQSHRGKLGRVAERLLHGSPCAVAVAPHGYADSPHDSLRTIGVAYVPTAEARAALGEATALARRAGASLRLISVTTAPEYAFAGADLPYPIETFGEVPDHHTHKALDEAVAEVPEDVSATGRLRMGSPAKEIRKECAAGVDLLVLGSRGYGAVRRVLLGSVTAKLVHSAPCPVLLVPQSTGERGDEATTAAVAG